MIKELEKRISFRREKADLATLKVGAINFRK